MSNPETQMTLDDAVIEVLGLLTGMDLQYDPQLDRYASVTRQLNRALRANALEHEWSYYSDVQSIGTAVLGEREVFLSNNIRVRIMNDDAVRLVDENGDARVWAYFLPRDAMHKYPTRGGLWASVTRNTLHFSRGFNVMEQGLDIQVPVMREPIMFRLPLQPEDPEAALIAVDPEIRNQLVDFAYPDVVILRAATYYAMTDPVMQPRVQTLEAQYKDLMYQIIERDDRNTDSPYENQFMVPVQSGLYKEPLPEGHALSDERQ